MLCLYLNNGFTWGMYLNNILASMLECVSKPFFYKTISHTFYSWIGQGAIYNVKFNMVHKLNMVISHVHHFHTDNHARALYIKILNFDITANL